MTAHQVRLCVIAVGVALDMLIVRAIRRTVRGKRLGR